MRSMELKEKKPKSKHKSKNKFLKEIQIKDISIENTEDIISLIKEKFGDNYYDKKFYDQNVIHHYTKRASEKDRMYWKGAFLKNQLIGQAMLEITHGVGFIKLTMISKQYQHSGILTLISYHLMSEISRLSSEELRYIYAIVSKNNEFVLKFIEKYGFHKLGSIPAWDRDESFTIYGRISRNMKDKWKLIDINMDLYELILSTIQNLKLKRYIQTRSKSNYFIDNSENFSFNFIIKDNIFPIEIEIRSKEKNLTTKTLAKYYENKFQKSWYDFHFEAEVSVEIKVAIIKELLEKFQNNIKINSLSLSININDNYLQEQLMGLGLQYYAYLPFYYISDHVLMGISKIRWGGPYAK